MVVALVATSGVTSYCSAKCAAGTVQQRLKDHSSTGTLEEHSEHCGSEHQREKESPKPCNDRACSLQNSAIQVELETGRAVVFPPVGYAVNLTIAAFDTAYLSNLTRRFVPFSSLSPPIKTVVIRI